MNNCISVRPVALLELPESHWAGKSQFGSCCQTQQGHPLMSRKLVGKQDTAQREYGCLSVDLLARNMKVRGAKPGTNIKKPFSMV